MRIVIIALLALTSFNLVVIKSVNSQDNFYPGSIVNLDGDTIAGYVEYLEWRFSPEKILFKIEPDSQPVIYNPKDIQAFQVLNFKYVSKQVDVTYMPRTSTKASFNSNPKPENSRRFLLLLLESYISLYQLLDNKDIEHYYVETAEGYVHELIYFKYYVTVDEKKLLNTNQKYIGQLIYYLKGCENFRIKIEKSSYSAPDLMKLFNNYNKCIGKQVFYDSGILFCQCQSVVDIFSHEAGC